MRQSKIVLDTENRDDTVLLSLYIARRTLLQEYKDIEFRNDLSYFTLSLLDRLHLIEDELELREKANQTGVT